MENRENQRVALTKRMLLEALLALLETRHIQQISVTELCSRAGINRTTFYKHYNTPNDVLEELERNYTAEMVKIQEDEQLPNAEKRIEACCVFLHQNKAMVRLLIRNGMDEEIATKALIKLFQQAAAASSDIDHSVHDETDQKLIITYIVNGCYSLLRTWLVEELPKTPQEIAALLYLVATKGWIREEVKV